MNTSTTSVSTPPDDRGSFSEDGQAYIVHTPRPPRPWYNYLWNEQFLLMVSEHGQGYSFHQDDMGRRIRFANNRMCYLRDEQTAEVWNANGVPNAVHDPVCGFKCEHGLGYSTITRVENAIESSLRMMVSERHACEQWTLTLRNQSDESRSLSVFPYVDAGQGGSREPQSYPMAEGKALSHLNTAVLEYPRSEGAVFSFLSSLQAVDGFDTRRDSFLGYGGERIPDTVARGKCGNTEATMDEGILALQQTLTLKPGEQVTLAFLAGVAWSVGEIEKIQKDFLQNPVDPALAQYLRKQNEHFEKTRFHSPDPTLNKFLSLWLKRQISLGIQWARVRHNGYRDQIQDIGAYAQIDISEALRQMKRVLGYQYATGYAPRTWLDGEILDKGFSDNHVWIPMAMGAILRESGEVSVLNEDARFNDGSRASLYEHAKRVVLYMWNDRGLHGFSLMHEGDWNDCMTRVGPRGKGVSVWLSMAFCVAADEVAVFADLMGNPEEARQFRDYAEEMRRNLDAHAWDGEYYVRAFSDTGEVIGSAKNEQGRLYLNTQTWAVLAGLERGERALRYAEQQLETELGIESVENAYDHYHDQVGPMSLKRPGIQENGGVYLHSCTFKLVADCQLKKQDKVSQLIRQMLPFTHSIYYQNCEPYVFSNCYFATKNSYRYGTAGQSWGTGTAGWFYTAMLSHVFGLKPEMRGLRIDPCLLPEWKTCAVDRHFRGAEYRVEYDLTEGFQCVGSIRVNGQTHSGTLLPCESGTRYHVEVRMIPKNN